MYPCRCGTLRSDSIATYYMRCGGVVPAHHAQKLYFSYVCKYARGCGCGLWHGQKEKRRKKKRSHTHMNERNKTERMRREREREGERTRLAVEDFHLCLPL